MEKVYDHIRVSSTDKHEDLQLIAMAEYGTPEISIYMKNSTAKFQKTSV